MGRKKKKRENSFDTILDQSLEKPSSRLSPRSSAKTWPRRHIRLVLSLSILVVIGLGTTVWAWQSDLLFPAASPHGMRAVLVDGLSVSYPDPAFTNNVTKTLTSAGYTVDYIGPDKFTVDTFANLPSEGYSLVIIRAHTAHSAIITPETYSSSKYVFEQLTGSIVPATIGTSAEYFAVTSQYISSEFHGKFPNSIIVLMGCGDPGDRETFAAAFADRGASYLIGYDNSVSAAYTDSDTSTLISALAHGNTVAQSVSIASGTDPVYHGQFGFVEASSISQQRITSFLSEIALFATFGIIVVFGPLSVFLIPKLLSRR
jgi:hypothetical protein